MRTSKHLVQRLGYTGARRLLVVVGSLVLAVLAVLMIGRGVERAEVLAVLLFVPVFWALVAFDIVGGLLGAVVATAVYVLLRRSAIDAVGSGQFLGVIVSHGVGFLVFGLLGGVANGALRQSFGKLDDLDTIDDSTGLNNARFFLESTALEIARATRYKTTFSVATLDIPAAPVNGLGRPKRAALLVELGKMLLGGARTVDRIVIAHDDSVYRVAAILPETGAAGAAVFAGRLVDRVGAFLLGHGVVIAPDAVSTATFPGDEAVVERIRREFTLFDTATAKVAKGATRG